MIYVHYILPNCLGKWNLLPKAYVVFPWFEIGVNSLFLNDEFKEKLSSYSMLNGMLSIQHGITHVGLLQLIPVRGVINFQYEIIQQKPTEIIPMIDYKLSKDNKFLFQNSLCLLWVGFHASSLCVS